MKIEHIPFLIEKIKEIIIQAKLEYKEEAEKGRYDSMAEIRDQLTIILGCSELLASTRHNAEEKLWAIKSLNQSARKIANKLEDYFKLPEIK